MPPARASPACCMDRGTWWLQGSGHGSSRACKRRGQCRWEASWKRRRWRGPLCPEEQGQEGLGLQHGVGAASSPLGGSAASPTHLERVPLSLRTQGTPGERVPVQPGLAPARALDTAWGEDLTPHLGEPATLWGRGHAHTHAHGHTHSHPDAHGGSHRPGAWGSAKSLHLGGAVSNEPLCWCPPPHTGVPKGAQPGQVWGPGHRPLLCFPCTDSLPTRHPQTHFI